MKQHTFARFNFPMKTVSIMMQTTFFEMRACLCVRCIKNVRQNANQQLTLTRPNIALRTHSCTLHTLYIRVQSPSLRWRINCNFTRHSVTVTLHATVLQWHCMQQCYSDTARYSVTVTLHATVLQWHCTLQCFSDTARYSVAVTLRATVSQWHCRLQCCSNTTRYSVVVTLHATVYLNIIYSIPYIQSSLNNNINLFIY